MERSSGILLHISSLPNKYGIGTFGAEAYAFVDYLKGAKQKLWQVLPPNQTGWGNSPYQSCASHSYNPFFISPEVLCGNNLITKEELKSAEYADGSKVDYGFVYETRYKLLRLAYSRFVPDKAFKNFIKEGRFNDYALFMALKVKFNYAPFQEWPDGLKRHYKRNLEAFEKRNKEEIMFWQFVQFEAEKEWLALKAYANKNGIKIIGDMPLYVSADSVDVWANPKLFKLDKNLYPAKVAGVPPDYFSATGQLWGNPVFQYGYHKRHEFSWWVNRICSTLESYDYVRIDHFRGLDRYYEIPAGSPDATNGKWVTVPSFSMFKQVDKKVAKDRIIAEDLGIIDGGVVNLMKHTGYPGMAVLCFAFNGEPKNTYLPENVKRNTVCYTGTHDNDTLMGFINSLSSWDYDNLQRGVHVSLKKLRLAKNTEKDENLAKSIIKLGFKCRANTFIIPMQDVLLLDSNYRMNTPGTMNNDNWTMRLKARQFTKSSQKMLAFLTERYDRA